MKLSGNIGDQDSSIALVSCPLQRGVAARMTQFVYDLGSDIVEHRQFVETERNHLFARLEWQTNPAEIPQETVAASFCETCAEPFSMEWNLHSSAEPVRMAVFVTKQTFELSAACDRKPFAFASSISNPR